MKRALLVGVDRYDEFNNLGGCVNDVHALAPLLSRNEDDTPNFQCQSLVSGGSEPTTDALREGLSSLLAAGADVALLYFAGHGSQDVNDVTLVTTNGTRTSPGVSFAEVMAKVHQSGVREVIIILDCCFSGAAGGIPQLGTSAAALRPGVSILTASRGDQTAAESITGRGIFSAYLCGALEGGAADVLGKVDAAGLYSYLAQCFGAWGQRPTFKANIERLHLVRTCAPSVPLADLRRLGEFFPSPDHHYSLDPSFEPLEEPHDEEHERIFGVLQRCRAAKLVEPVDADHMYFAAMDAKACRLTPLGKLYHQMAVEGRL